MSFAEDDRRGFGPEPGFCASTLKENVGQSFCSEPFAKVDACTQLLGKGSQLGDLIAVRLRAAPGSVDHWRADDHGPNRLLNPGLAYATVNGGRRLRSGSK